MKKSIYSFSLDLHSTVSQVSVPMKKGDRGRRLIVSFREYGKPYHFEKDCFVVFSARKPDGNVIESNCTLHRDEVIIDIPSQTTTADGVVECELKLYGSSVGPLASPSFLIVVDSRAVNDSQVESASDFSALTKLYSELSQVLSREAFLYVALENGTLTLLQSKPVYNVSVSNGHLFFELTEATF